MLAIIIGFLVGVIGVSIIRVIWYVFSWILIKTVLTIRKLSDSSTFIHVKKSIIYHMI